MKVKDSKSTIDWYDKSARNYSNKIEPFLSKDLADKFVSYLGKRKNILDAGCAAGRDSIYFHNLGLNVTGIDLSEGLIKIAKKKHPQIKFVKGDFRKLPFSDHKFDGIWAHASLVHMETLEDTKISLKEFKRVLKPSGVFYTFVKTRDKETDIVSDKLSGHDRFFRYYSKKQIELLLKEVGFSILDSMFYKDPAGRKEVKWIAVFAKKPAL